MMKASEKVHTIMKAMPAEIQVKFERIEVEVNHWFEHLEKDKGADAQAIFDILITYFVFGIVYGKSSEFTND